jgi:hypothetical protein
MLTTLLLLFVTCTDVCIPVCKLLLCSVLHWVLLDGHVTAQWHAAVTLSHSPGTRTTIALINLE